MPDRGMENLSISIPPFCSADYGGAVIYWFTGLPPGGHYRAYRAVEFIKAKSGSGVTKPRGRQPPSVEICTQMPEGMFNSSSAFSSPPSPLPSSNRLLIGYLISMPCSACFRRDLHG